MSFVKVSRNADIVYNYDENGIAHVPILEGECKDCALERVSIQPGSGCHVTGRICHRGTGKADACEGRGGRPGL